MFIYLHYTIFILFYVDGRRVDNDMPEVNDKFLKFPKQHEANTRRLNKTMEITDIKIRKIITEGRLRAVVSITIDRMLAVHDIKIVQGDERLFIAMPSRRDENGVFRDIVHPIMPEGRKMIEDSILDAYQKYLALAEIEEQANQKSAVEN